MSEMFGIRSRALTAVSLLLQIRKNSQRHFAQLPWLVAE
jgi:hypothetical protein